MSTRRTNRSEVGCIVGVGTWDGRSHRQTSLLCMWQRKSQNQRSTATHYITWMHPCFGSFIRLYDQPSPKFGSQSLCSTHNTPRSLRGTHNTRTRSTGGLGRTRIPRLMGCRRPRRISMTRGGSKSWTIPNRGPPTVRAIHHMKFHIRV